MFLESNINLYIYIENLDISNAIKNEFFMSQPFNIVKNKDEYF